MRRITLMVAAVLLATLPAIAQTAKVHGHVQNPLGSPIADIIVILSDDPTMANPKYTFNTDADGNYKGEGIKPGSYVVSIRKADTPKDKVIDQFVGVKFTDGADVAQDFDMTRPDYMSKMSPEERKQIEDLRKKNADVMKENAGIKNLNANLVKAREDNKTKNYAEAETLMLQSTVAMPTSSILWLELGVAQSGLKKYSDAEASLKKAIELDATAKKPNPEVVGTANNTLGEVYAQQSKLPEASAAYDAAVKANPAQAGMYYSNQAVIYTRVNQPEAAVVAADKAIAAEPTRPIAYYLKGQALINKATVDKNTGKIVAPPGCVEAYQKYLELAPTGQFAPEVKAVLSEVSTTVKTTYKAKK